MRVKITPIFSTKEIVSSTIRKSWFEYQYRAFLLGDQIHKYMQSFINSHRRRAGGSGNLARSINLRKSTGVGYIFWGIGDIGLLMAKAPYWYVTNFGKKITGELFVPPASTGSFGGNPPISTMRGKGTEKWTHPGKYFMRPKTAVRPINYIQASRHKLDIAFNKLLSKLGSK